MLKNIFFMMIIQFKLPLLRASSDNLNSCPKRGQNRHLETCVREKWQHSQRGVLNRVPFACCGKIKSVLKKISSRKLYIHVYIYIHGAFLWSWRRWLYYNLENIIYINTFLWENIADSSVYIQSDIERERDRKSVV